jgi:hypothetical protein
MQGIRPLKLAEIKKQSYQLRQHGLEFQLTSDFQIVPAVATKSHIVNENKYKGRRILTLVHHVAAIWFPT